MIEEQIQALTLEDLKALDLSNWHYTEKVNDTELTIKQDADGNIALQDFDLEPFISNVKTTGTNVSIAIDDKAITELVNKALDGFINRAYASLAEYLKHAM